MDPSISLLMLEFNFKVHRTFSQKLCILIEK